MKFIFAPTTLAQITLNTGHIRNLPLYRVEERAIETLAPLVQAGGGAIPNCPGWSCKIRCNSIGAYFSISEHQSLMIVCVLAWDANAAPELWTESVKRVLWYSDSTMKMPSTLPWLAVNLLPIFISRSPSDVLILGELECCLAWTIIQTSKRFPNRSPHYAN